MLEKHLMQLQKGAMTQTYLRGLVSLPLPRLLGVHAIRTEAHSYEKYCNGCKNVRAPTNYSLPVRLTKNISLLQTPTHNHSINQSRSYHILLCDVKSGRRSERKLLTDSLTVSATSTVFTRSLSMDWLDSLAVSQSSWFQSLAQSQFVEGIMSGLQVFHDSLHIPWWSSIILSTILLRSVITVPLALYQIYIMAKVENLKGELDGLVKELRIETAIATKKFGWTENYARYMFYKSLKKLRKDLIIRDNCHPVKASLLLWFQIPLWVGMSVSLRNMASMMPHQDAAAQVLFLQLSTGGVSWIPNLTVMDHSLILPFAMGITNLLIVEVNALSRISKSRMQTIITNMFRVICIGLIPIASTMPSCVVLYWVTSSVYGLVQNLTLMHPKLRQACGIPNTPSQNPTPYQHLWLQLQNRFTRNKS